jgi:hypothetical protein
MEGGYESESFILMRARNESKQGIEMDCIVSLEW